MPRISAPMLRQRLKQGQIDPVYFLVGEETYLIHEYTSHLTTRILGTAPRDFNCDVFHAEQDSLAEALSAAHTLPVMAAHRVVVLHGVHHLRKSDWSLFERYLAQPSASTALICSASTPETQKFPACLWQQTVVVECARLEGTKLRDWVSHTAAQYGGRITEEAIHGLLHEQEHDLHMLVQEIEKLCTYVGEAGEITLNDVQEVCQASRLHSIFILSEAFNTGKIGAALTAVERLLNQGEPPLVILSMIVRHLRLLWSLKQLSQERQESSRMAKTLGIPLAVCRQLATQSQRFSSRRLQHLYAVALAADVAFKTSNKPPQAILTGLILDICAGAKTA